MGMDEMTIYVDSLSEWNHSGLWCHMMIAHDADVEELHKFAAKIGLKREWFQDRQYFPHYDLRPNKRYRAIIEGAIQLKTPSEKMEKCSRDPKIRVRFD